MTPLDLILWALAAAVAIVVIGLALGVAIAMLNAFRDSNPRPTRSPQQQSVFDRMQDSTPIITRKAR